MRLRMKLEKANGYIDLLNWLLVSRPDLLLKTRLNITVTKCTTTISVTLAYLPYSHVGAFNVIYDIIYQQPPRRF
jgi:hypothetical protein